MQHFPELKDFICKHSDDDVNQLLLSASRFPEIDMPYAVDQIIARRHIKEKLPTWYRTQEIIYPSPLTAEQCSSELTARYKAKLLKGTRFCDLTGGLGVDCFYFAQQAKQAFYIERFPDYCEAARHNFKMLQAEHIQVMQGDCRELLSDLKSDTFYIDPARRNKDNKRTFALSDCEPDLLQLKPLLLERAQRIIIKISPMADLEETLHLLPETCEIHILAVKNECKELLFVIENNILPLSWENIPIHAVNLQWGKESVDFVFTLPEEKTAPLQTAKEIETYLYEPHAALLKSGAFKLIAFRYNLQKLHRHSHLYTSSDYIPDFPGRSFRVEKRFDFSGKLLKKIAQELPKANLTTRNFPLSVAELRKRSGIKEGGNIYLFATTLSNEQKILIQTVPATP